VTRASLALRSGDRERQATNLEREDRLAIEDRVEHRRNAGDQRPGSLVEPGRQGQEWRRDEGLSKVLEGPRRRET
jgi:hypothetical protein